jgi:hypothetical protein
LPHWACLPGVFSFDASAGLPRSVVGPRLRQFHPWSGARDSPRVPDNPARAVPPAEAQLRRREQERSLLPTGRCASPGSYSVHLHAIKENQKTHRPTGYSHSTHRTRQFGMNEFKYLQNRIPGIFRALAVGILAAFLSEFLRTPIPWMIGPMVGVASLNLMGKQMHSPRTPVKWVK